MSGTGKDATVSEPASSKSPVTNIEGLRYVPYGSEGESPFLPAIRQLISKDLSEPYSIYVYRYFLYQWPDLSFLCLDENESLLGVIVCKLEPHRGGPMRGYIAMLATREEYRGRGIASRLVRIAVQKMIEKDADEVLLHHFDNTISNLLTSIPDRLRNRSRQHPIPPHLREIRLSTNETTSPILFERQHGFQTSLVSQTRHSVQADLSTGLYAVTR